MRLHAREPLRYRCPRHGMVEWHAVGYDVPPIASTHREPETMPTPEGMTPTLVPAPRVGELF